MKKILGLILVLVIVFLLFQSEVKMEDFVSRELYLIEEFASKNNIELEVSYEYSDFDENIVLSQSIKEKESLKNVEKILVSVSNGISYEEAYKKYSVNELGRIPIMMYHGIYDMKDEETDYTGGNVDFYGYHRTTESFKRDLEFFYKNDYVMIRLQDYIDGNINLKIGKSPIVLTFDDGLRNNINVLGLDEDGEIIIDPSSAVGILESFKKKYPDFNVTATFFLNGELFNQKEYNDKILNWLIENGYDIGNHTFSHPNLTRLDRESVKREIGKMYSILNEKTEGRHVNIVALPFGTPASFENKNFEFILGGSYKGFDYETEATLRVGWESDFSPYDSRFDKRFIKRIRAYDNDGVDFDIEQNFKFLESNKYISSGRNDVIVYPKEMNIEVKKEYLSNVLTY